MEQPDYQEQNKVNETIFKEIARSVRPDVWSVMDALDSTGVNYVVVLKAIHALALLAGDTKYGTVTIEVQDNMGTFVRGLHTDRLNEPIVK